MNPPGIRRVVVVAGCSFEKSKRPDEIANQKGTLLAWRARALGRSQESHRTRGILCCTEYMSLQHSLQSSCRLVRKAKETSSYHIIQEYANYGGSEVRRYSDFIALTTRNSRKREFGLVKAVMVETWCWRTSHSHFCLNTTFRSTGCAWPRSMIYGLHIILSPRML